MSSDQHPAQELAELVAELRQLTQSWREVGARQVGWAGTEPCWPDHQPEAAAPAPLEPPGVLTTPAPQAAAMPPEPGAPAALFPPSQPRPHALPARKEPADGLGLWAGYGARATADATLGQVREKLGECTRCPLHRGRTKLVFGVGSARADLVIVGEAPGFHEDQQGEPFVGPAGQMLDRMLENVLGLKREQVYIMNVLKCRPPGNRDPEIAEVAECRPFFDAQINVIRPTAILALGRYAAQTLLDTSIGIKTLRGSWGEYRGVPVMPTFHPAYLLRTPADKRLTLQDLLTLKRRLAGPEA